MMRMRTALRRVDRLCVALLLGVVYLVVASHVSAGATVASDSAVRQASGRVDQLTQGKWSQVHSIDVSGNGRFVTYYEDDHQTVQFRDRNKRKPVKLASGLHVRPEPPMVSGNGRYVIYVGMRRASSPPIGSEHARWRAKVPLVRWDRVTNTRREIANYAGYGFGRGYDISDDGNTIAVLTTMRDSGGQPRIALWDADSDSLTTIAKLDYSAPDDGVGVAISGDGTKVAYFAEADYDCSTFLWDRSTSESVTIAPKSKCLGNITSTPAPTITRTGDLVTWPGTRREPRHHSLVDATFLWSAETNTSRRVKDLGAVTNDGSAIVFTNSGRIGRQVLSTGKVIVSPKIRAPFDAVAPSNDGKVVAFRPMAATNAFWNAAVWIGP